MCSSVDATRYSRGEGVGEELRNRGYSRGCGRNKEQSISRKLNATDTCTDSMLPSTDSVQHADKCKIA